MKTKSNYKKKVISILVEINRLVTEHLKVQKSIFNPPLRDKIFKRVDFEGLYETNNNIQAEIHQIIKELHNNKNELNIDPFVYGGIKDYALLLYSSSEKLTQIAFELHLKSKKQNQLTVEEYNQLVREYEILENSRMKKGETIQKIAGLLAH